MCFHQWYWHCAWKANNARLTRILYFLQRCCLFPRMLYFWFSILEKKNVYTMILMPAMNSALYCCTYYIYMYTIWQNYWICSQQFYVSRKMCIWYWTHMSAISSFTFCIFWKVFCILSCCSWVLSKKEHVQIEHALLQKIV